MNPYLRADRIQRRNFWRAHPGRSLWIFMGPVLLGLLAAPLSQPVLLWFSGLESQAFAAGLSGLGLRLGLCGPLLHWGGCGVLRETTVSMVFVLNLSPGGRD